MLASHLDYGMMSNMKTNKTHKTAISRNKLSAPVQWLLDNDHIKQRDHLLDYGCGKGTDVDFLNGLGIQTWAYDPYWFDVHFAKGVHDVVLCTYVLNVIFRGTDAYDCVRGCIEASNGGPIFFAVRNDKSNLKGWTKRNTYQWFVPLGFVQEVCNRVSVGIQIPARIVTEVHKTSSYVIYKAECV